MSGVSLMILGCVLNMIIIDDFGRLMGEEDGESFIFGYFD